MALVGGNLDGVFAWVDAEQFSLGEDTTTDFNYLRHNVYRFMF